jgi:hypothetical protein
MHLRDYSCVLCSKNVKEDLCHLIFDYLVAMACWLSLNLVVPFNSDPASI